MYRYTPESRRNWSEGLQCGPCIHAMKFNGRPGPGPQEANAQGAGFTGQDGSTLSAPL